MSGGGWIGQQYAERHPAALAALVLESACALLVSPMAVADAMKAAMPALWCFDARPWLGRLRCPTLVVAGAADPVVPLPHAQAVQQAIPGAQLSVIASGGHVPSAQGNAQARAAIAQFLRASTSDRPPRSPPVL